MFRYILYILIAGIIMYMLLGLLKPNTVKTTSRANKDDSIKSFDKIKYLAENSELKEDKEGTLYIYKDSIVFDDGISELFSIPIKSISKCMIEADNKSSDRHVRINLKNKYNGIDNVIFYSYFNEEYSNDIVNEINKRLKGK